MTTISKLPSLTSSFEKMKLMLDIKTKAAKDTILGMSIVNAIEKEVNPDKVILFIKQQAQDGKQAMANVIGEELTEKIMAL